MSSRRAKVFAGVLATVLYPAILLMVAGEAVWNFAKLLGRGWRDGYHHILNRWGKGDNSSSD